MSAPELPHRLTPTERLHEVTMAAMGRPRSVPEQSVTVTRNAKGHFQFEVTVRAEDITDCIAEVKDAIAELCDLYPYPVANGGET